MTAREFSRMRGLRFATAAKQVRMRREMHKQGQLTRLGELLTGNPWAGGHPRVWPNYIDNPEQ